MATFGSLSMIKQHFKETSDYRLEIIEDLLKDSSQVSSPAPRPESEERSVVILWMISVAEELKIDHEVLELAVNYYDRFMCVQNLERELLQLAAYSCFLLAEKFAGDGRLSVFEGIELCAQQYSEQEFVDMETLVLQALSWKLHRATPIEIARNFLQVTNMDYDFSEVIKKTTAFIEVCLADDELSRMDAAVVAVISAECALEMCDHSSFREGWLAFLSDSFEIELDVCQIAKQQLLALVNEGTPSAEEGREEEDLFSETIPSSAVTPQSDAKAMYYSSSTTAFTCSEMLSFEEKDGSEMLAPLPYHLSTDFCGKKPEDFIDDGISSCSTSISPFCAEKYSGRAFPDSFFAGFQGTDRVHPSYVAAVRSEEMDMSAQRQFSGFLRELKRFQFHVFTEVFTSHRYIGLQVSTALSALHQVISDSLLSLLNYRILVISGSGQKSSVTLSDAKRG